MITAQVHFDGAGMEFMNFAAVPRPGEKVMVSGWPWYVSTVTHHPSLSAAPAVAIELVKYASESGGPHG